MDPGAKRLVQGAQRPQGPLGPGAKRLFSGAQRPQGPLGPGANCVNPIAVGSFLSVFSLLDGLLLLHAQLDQLL